MPAFYERPVEHEATVAEAATILVAQADGKGVPMVQPPPAERPARRGTGHPSNRLRGWSSTTSALENLRTDLETKNGQPLFLIADERDRAAEIAFYLRDKRTEGPGHPPVYVVESQDLENQFSFWPRYDEFVEQPSRPAASPNEVYTEENGVNLFVDRSSLYIQEGPRQRAPHNIRAGFQSVERIATIESRRFGTSVRTWQIFLCHNYRTLSL